MHSDLQRQLLGLLRNLGPDILIDTHSLDIVTEAEPDDIVLVSRRRQHARRVKQPSQLTDVFAILGSNINPILTQLAKTRRALFIEGNDFQIIGKFARKLGYPSVSNRNEFATIPVHGFNPERVRNLKTGIETTLGGKINAAAIFDRDYRSHAERESLANSCLEFCQLVLMHSSKEIENLLLVPEAIDRAATRRAADQARRGGKPIVYTGKSRTFLDEFAEKEKAHVLAQHLSFRRAFERINSSSLDPATIDEESLKEIESLWADQKTRLKLIPGKTAISALNETLQRTFFISVTLTAIIDAMRDDEVPEEARELVEKLDEFAKSKVS